MNRPCRIHFHDDAAPPVLRLPERYRNNVEDSDFLTNTLLVQNAFPVDFANGSIIRTRVSGTREEDPVDFPLASISHIEWFYGSEVPEPLVPWTPPPARYFQGATVVDKD